MTTKKETQNNNFNATIGNTVLSAVAFILFSCKEPIKVKPDRNLDFIVTEKVSLKNETGGFDYFLKNKDTIIEVSTQDYAQWNISDTLKLKIVGDGFWKGRIAWRHSR